MAAVESTMLPLGTRAPELSLPDTNGKPVALVAGHSATVVMFICNHCPFVKHIAGELAALGRDYASKDVQIIAINSNDIETYPADGPDAMREEVETRGYVFPYLLDAGQTVAKAYRAACTPDFYVFDGELELVYRGQFDDSRPSNGKPVTGADLRRAIDAVLDGSQPDGAQTPSIGCNIKWIAGNEPDYFG